MAESVLTVSQLKFIRAMYDQILLGLLSACVQLVLGSSDNTAGLSGCFLLCWWSQGWQHVQLREV